MGLSGASLRHQISGLQHSFLDNQQRLRQHCADAAHRLLAASKSVDVSAPGNLHVLHAYSMQSNGVSSDLTVDRV